MMLLPSVNEQAEHVEAVKNRGKAALLDWLLRLPVVKAQAYFWNYSSRTERRKAMLADMKKEQK